MNTPEAYTHVRSRSLTFAMFSLYYNTIAVGFLDCATSIATTRAHAQMHEYRRIAARRERERADGSAPTSDASQTVDDLTRFARGLLCRWARSAIRNPRSRMILRLTDPTVTRPGYIWNTLSDEIFCAGQFKARTLLFDHLESKIYFGKDHRIITHIGADVIL